MIPVYYKVHDYKILGDGFTTTENNYRYVSDGADQSDCTGTGGRTYHYEMKEGEVDGTVEIRGLKTEAGGGGTEVNLERDWNRVICNHT